MAKSTQPIIIKKVKKAGHAHHGGAWKIAYADFVTAMMAFFLLMWLISMTTQEQKDGLAEYFAPTSALSSGTSGSGGILMGTALDKSGNKTSAPATRRETRPGRRTRRGRPIREAPAIARRTAGPPARRPTTAPSRASGRRSRTCPRSPICRAI